MKESNLIQELKAGIYPRVSTDEQAEEGYSIKAQIEKMKLYCSMKGYQIHNIYTDAGFSGKNIDGRPGLKNLIEDVKAKRVNVVLVYKVDRLTRSTKDLAYLIELFQEYECEFSSIVENIDTHTPTGRLFIKFLGIFAEFERENIIERTKMGYSRKASEGYIVSHVPYGYDREIGKRDIYVNSVEAPIVIKVFHDFVYENASITSIAISLNLQDIRTRKGNAWNNKAIKKMLINPIYTGKVSYHHRQADCVIYEGLHEPIIDEETFEKANVLLGKNRNKIITKYSKENRLFTGVLICEKCGRRLATYTKIKTVKGDKREYISYRCPNKTIHACDAKQIAQIKLEEQFLDYIKNIVEFDTIDAIDLEEKENDDIEVLLSNLKKKRERLHTKKQSIMDTFVNDSISFDDYKILTEKIDRQINEVLAEIVASETLQKTKDKEQVLKREEIATTLRDIWTELNSNDKKEFLTRFINKIIINNDGVHSSIKDIIFYTDM